MNIVVVVSREFIHAIVTAISQNLVPRVEMPNARGHALKVRGGKFRGDVRGKCFTQLVHADMIGAVKGLLDKHMNMQGMEGFGPRADRRD